MWAWVALHEPTACSSPDSPLDISSQGQDPTASPDGACRYSWGKPKTHPISWHILPYSVVQWGDCTCFSGCGITRRMEVHDPSLPPPPVRADGGRRGPHYGAWSPSRLGASHGWQRASHTGRAPSGCAHAQCSRRPCHAHCWRCWLYRRAGVAGRRFTVQRYSQQAHCALASSSASAQVAPWLAARLGGRGPKYSAGRRRRRLVSGAT